MTPVKATADERGVANIVGLPAASVQLHVESGGFTARDVPVTLRRGANTHTVTLAIEGFQEQVQVDDTAFIATSFPDFAEMMRGLGADYS